MVEPVDTRHKTPVNSRGDGGDPYVPPQYLKLVARFGFQLLGNPFVHCSMGRNIG